MNPRDLEEPLNDLKFHWGSAYLIEHLGGRYVAQRRDNRTSISADTPDGLLAKIRADYEAAPVPRPSPSADAGPPGLRVAGEDDPEGGPR